MFLPKYPFCNKVQVMIARPKKVQPTRSSVIIFDCRSVDLLVRLSVGLSLCHGWLTLGSHPENLCGTFWQHESQLTGAWSTYEQNIKKELPHPLEQRQYKDKVKFPCRSPSVMEVPHFCRLLWWKGMSKYSRKYSGWLVLYIKLNVFRTQHSPELL